MGQDPCEVERLSVVSGRALFGHPFTKAALEMAMWDILGKAAGLPVYRLLGGKVRESVPTKWSVSGVEPAKAAEIAQWANSKGFKAMKVKVGIDPGSDVARVRAVREAIGTQIKLGVDANGGWTPEDAVKTIGRLREFDIYFAEQPVSPENVALLQEVRKQIHVPVIADESVYSLQDAMTLERLGAADVFSIYIG